MAIGKTEQSRNIAGYLDFLLELAQNPQVANKVGTREKAARGRNARRGRMPLYAFVRKASFAYLPRKNDTS